jgi:hypothetical protein
MSHDFHKGPEGAVLYDGCPECDARAADPIEALLRMDSVTFSHFENRMFDVEYEHRGSYLTDNEAKVGRVLYLISILNERHGAVMHR